MTQMRFLMVALLATVAWTGAASGYFFDIWPTTADGNMNTHYQEGYAIAGEGSIRLAKYNHHFPYLGFGQEPGNVNSGYSDGPDGIPQGRSKGGVNDKADGVLMADWMVGKKAFHAALYIRNAAAQTCDPFLADGSLLNDPNDIVGFRVANVGPFVDRGTDATGAQLAGGHTGCCAGYDAPLLDGGENAPPAWRIGRPPYSQIGAIGSGDPGVTPEYYKCSLADTLHPGAEVKLGNGFFGTTGFGGFSTNSGLPGSGWFAFDWLVRKSDAMMFNSSRLVEADCTGVAGEEEPRDFAGDGTIAEGWYGKLIDRCIVQGIAFDPEVKGLVLSAIPSTFGLNNSYFTRDQGGGGYGPYLAITATLEGDGPNNDGCVDVVDLLDLVAGFGSVKGDINFNSEVDWNCDGAVDVVDLLTLVGQFGNCVP